MDLVINATRGHVTGGDGPTRPTLFPASFAEPQQFANVEALAQHIHRQRGDRPMELRPTRVSYGASDLFDAFGVYWLPDGGVGSADFAFTVAIQTDRRERLEAALDATLP